MYDNYQQFMKNEVRFLDPCALSWARKNVTVHCRFCAHWLDISARFDLIFFLLRLDHITFFASPVHCIHPTKWMDNKINYLHIQQRQNGRRKQGEEKKKQRKKRGVEAKGVEEKPAQQKIEN